ncbi:MAG: tetratricopeptide repeat protein [Ignavibacteriae bacterium]|nr:tetratricopeptide repeat protein [Ignavibacteriota bacterium]
MTKKLFIFIAVMLVQFYGLIPQTVEPLYDYSSSIYSRSKEFSDIGLIRKSETAIIEIIRQGNSSPVKDNAELLYAYTEYMTNNTILADARLEKFINDRSNSPLKTQAAMLRAYFAFDHKNYYKAEKLFDEAKIISEKEYALRKDSVYVRYAHSALYWHATALSQQGKYQDAEPIYSECFQKYPNEDYADDALYSLGLIAETNGRHEIASNYYNTIAKKYPYSNTFVASRIREANNKLILRNPSSSIVIIENVENKLSHIRDKDSIGLLYEEQSFSELASEDIQYLRVEADNLSGNFDDAVVIAKSFLETFAQSRLTNYVRLGAGWALLNQGRNIEAIKYYDDILNDHEETDNNLKSTAMLYRLVALKRSGDPVGAKKGLLGLSVLPNYPYLAQVLLELGQIYYEEGDYESAQKTLEHAERESRDAVASVRIHLLLGATYIELNMWDKAALEYRDARQIALKSSPIFMPNRDWYIAESRLKEGIALVKSHRNSAAIPVLNAFIAENKKDNRIDEATFWLAEAYYRSDLLRNASDTYDNLLEQYPNTARREEALYGQGWSYFRLKRFDKSSSIFDKLIREYPETKFGLEVLSRQGDGYYITKNFKQAAATYQKAASLYPNTEDGQYCAYQMCHALYRQGEMEDAVTNLIGFVRKYPSSSYAPYALYLNGWIRFQQQKYGEAIDNYKYLLQAYPQAGLVPRTHYAIGDAYYNMGNFESAIASYKVVIESYPSSPLAPEAMKSMQYCLTALGRNEEAMKLADTFIETNPTSPFAEEFRFKKAEMFYTGKNYADAISEYQNFIKSHPESERNAEAMYWMGKSYVNQSDNEKAEQAFDEILTKYPKSEFAPLSMLEHGLLKKQMNQVVGADSIFRKLQELFPEHDAAGQAGFERAVIRLAIGDTVKAMKVFRDISEKFRGQEYGDQSRYQIAMYLRQQNQMDSALAEFEILATNMDNPLLAAEAQFRIGEIWMLRKNYEKASEAFALVRDRFTGQEDWFTKSLLNLGECYEQLGNTDSAAEVYQSIISLRGDDDFGKTAKNRLKRLR